MTFKPLLPSHFFKQFKKLTKKDAALGMTECRGRESLPLQRRDESCPALITFAPRHSSIYSQIYIDSSGLLPAVEKTQAARTKPLKIIGNGITFPRLKDRRCLRIYSWEWSQQRLGKKIKAICENPEIGEPKSHKLKGLRGEHVDPFVIIYGVFGDIIVFVHVDHHDKAYAAAYEIAKALIDDNELLTTLAKVGVTPKELAVFVESIGR
jgi:mRNA-degrading endonuclease RelE of RelBE toxin-antitoxin system